MGRVLKGFTKRSILEITNPGQIPVSFQADLSALQDTGFSVDLGLIKSLPPSHSVAFEVHFESAHQPPRDLDVLLPIEVTNGPMSHIRLCATVLAPSLELSKNTLQFSDILVGQCQVETIRLYNRFQAPCKWSIKPVLKVFPPALAMGAALGLAVGALSTASVSQSTQEVRLCPRRPRRPHTVGFCAQKDQHKYVTPALRQKQRAPEDEPCPFEVMPSQGTLDPQRWQNLQIWFTPKEERSYKNELKLNMCGSSNHLKLHLSGRGLEPRLEFSPPALNMGWVLVDSDGVEATAVVKNPCSFPIEFYSLDFEEVKILRMALGSENQKSFLMPPRAVGGTLLPKVLEDYGAQKRLKAQQAELKTMAKAKVRAEAEDKGKAAPGQKNSEGLAVSVLTVVTAGSPFRTP
ncbi:hydrocephalus-inducing protein homolog [Taeniopygia guttata]|uniref:hydrocephalus-inducing protein homolog n=1 Tax=Taeniopygia guttata TaxID=59729 RepID=UPI003BB88DEA